MPTAGDVIRSSPLPDHEARRLLVTATGRSAAQLIAAPELAMADLARFRELESLRLAGEPLQYLEGSVPFGPATIAVDPRVLIPRPETEELLELAIGAVTEPQVIVDVCTGSGNLAVALAMSFPDADVYGTDIAQEAIDVARANARRNGVSARFGVGDLFDPLPDEIIGRVDLLVANPPYLAESEMQALPEDVRREPPGALVSGAHGLDALVRIAAGASSWLSADAVMIIEVSEFHARRAASLFAGFDVEVRADLFGKDRFVVASSGVE